jgi:hypothetical protein
LQSHALFLLALLLLLLFTHALFLFALLFLLLFSHAFLLPSHFALAVAHADVP